MQQTEAPTAALIAATSTNSRTRGAPSRIEDDFKACTQPSDAPSLGDVNSTSLTCSSATTTVYVRAEGAAGGLSLASEGDAARGTAFVAKSSSRATSTRNGSPEGSDAADEKAELPAQGSVASVAFGRTFSLTEAKDKGIVVDADALACPSPGLSPGASDTAAQTHDSVYPTTTLALLKQESSSGGNSTAGTSSTLIPEDNHPSTGRRPVTGASTQATALPGSGIACTSATVAACVSMKRIPANATQVHVAADDQKKTLPTAAAFGHEGTDTITDVTAADKEETLASGPFLLPRDKCVLPKYGGAADNRETTETPAATTYTVTASSESSQQEGTASSAARRSLAVSADKHRCGSLLTLFDSTDSSALLLPPSVARERLSAFPTSDLDLESLLPSLQSQPFVPPATVVLSDDHVADSSSRLAERILETTSVKCGTLSWHTSASSTEKRKKTRCIPGCDSSEACQQALLLAADSADGRTATGAGRAAVAEDEVVSCAGVSISKSRSSFQSPLEPSVFAADARPKHAESLLPTSTATAETPSTVTSSSSSGSALSSCSPASFSPSVETGTFHHSSLTSTSDPSPAAQHSCAKAYSSSLLPHRRDFFTRAVYKTLPAKRVCATSPTRSSGTPSVSLPPAAGSCLLYTRLPPGSLQGSVGMPKSKEGLVTAHNVVAEANREQDSPAGAKPFLAPEPCPPPSLQRKFPALLSRSILSSVVGTATSIRWQSPVETVSEESQQPVTASQHTKSAVSEQAHQQALGPQASVTAISHAGAVRTNAIDTGTPCKDTKDRSTVSAFITQGLDEANGPAMQSSAMASPTSCFALRSPLPPGAPSAAVGPHDSSVTRSHAAVRSSESDRPSCKTASRLGLPAAVLGATTDGAVQPEVSAAVGRMGTLLTISLTDATSGRQARPPGNLTGANPGVTMASSGPRDWSSPGGQGCVPRNFLAVGSETCGSTGHRGGDSNASNLQVRCLLAASLRSIFKMLIKRVRQQQHQHIRVGSSDAQLSSMAEVNGSDVIGSKRRRVNKSPCQACEVYSVSCHCHEKISSSGNAISSSFVETGYQHVSAGQKAGAPLHEVNGSGEESCKSCNPSRHWRQAENLQSQPNARVTAIRPDSFLTSLSGAPRRGSQVRLQDVARQKATRAAAADILQEKVVQEEAQQDPAVQSRSLLSDAGDSDPHGRLSPATMSLRQVEPEPSVDAVPRGITLCRVQHGDRAGRLDVTASSKGSLEAGPCPAAPLLPALRRPSLSTVPQTGAAASLARGCQREADAAADGDDDKSRSASCRISPLSGSNCSCTSTVCMLNCSTGKPYSASTNEPLTKMTQKLPALCPSTVKGCRPCPPTFAAEGRPVRALCYGSPCRCRVWGRCCPRDSKMASVRDAAALAEQQLLAAYRECFLLLTAAERKEELYIFEFVLLGGTCQNETASPRKQNSAAAPNSLRSGVGEGQQQLSQQPYGHLPAAENGRKNVQSTLHGDAAANLPSEAELLGSTRILTAEKGCAQKGQLTCADKGLPGMPVHEIIDESGGARSARYQRLPTFELDAAEVTRKRRRQIALQPEKWDAKKIHYVLAALDGLRDAWRQGSSNTRAKAQILESMFTPLPQGLQQRILQLTQRSQVGGLTHHVQPQKVLRQSPLQKFFDFQQVLASDTTTAARNADKPAACNNVPRSCSQDAKTSGVFSSAGRNLPVPLVARPLTSIQSTPCSSACARDETAHVRGSITEVACGQEQAPPYCCGNQHCHRISTYCRGVSCSCSHISSSACCSSHRRGNAGCECGQKEASGCDAGGGGQKEQRTGLTSHRLCESHSRCAPKVLSGCTSRFPANPDTQLPEKRCETSRPEASSQRIAHHQLGQNRLRQPHALTSDGSTTVGSTRLAEESRVCSLDSSAGGTLHWKAPERTESACSGCSGVAEPLEASTSGRSRGECTTATGNAKGLRRGKLKINVAGSSAVDDGKDVYRKPRPSVVSRRMLLQRQVQRQRRRSITHAAGTSDSDLDITSTNASSSQNKKGAVPAARQLAEANIASASETANEGRFPPCSKEGELLELGWHKLAAEDAAKRERGTVKVGEGHDLARLRRAGKYSSDSPASASGPSQGTRLMETFSSKVSHSDELTLESDPQREETQAFLENGDSISSAPPSVATGESLTHARSRSGSLLLSAPHVQTAQDMLKHAGNKSSTNSASHYDSDLDVEAHRALPSMARTTSSTRALALSLEVLQGESLISGAQQYTNLSDEGTCPSVTRFEQGFSKEAAKGMLRAAGPAETNPNINCQQHTAAMRTTRHNKTKQPGVFQFTRGPKRFWAASWYADGHPGWKAFSVEKWGNREAFERARRAYEEKVPRKCRAGGAATNDLPEVVVSSVRLPYRPASPHANTSLAHRAVNHVVSGANCARAGVARGGKNSVNKGSGRRASSSAVSKAKRRTSLKTSTTSAKLRPLEKCNARLPVAEASSTQVESLDLVESHIFVEDSVYRRTCGQAVEEKQGLIQVRRNSQNAELTAEKKSGLSVVLSAQAASYGTAASHPFDREKGILEGSSHAATSPSESVAFAKSRVVWTQGAQQPDQMNGHSTNICQSKGAALFDTGTKLTLSYKGDSEQLKSFAEASNLERSRGGSLGELWNSCSSGAGVLSLGAAFTGKEVSPSVYDSSCSTGFDLIAPTFSVSPRSLSQLHRPLSRQHQEELRQGLEQLLLSSAPVVNEGEECSETDNERHRKAVERNVILQTQQKNHSDIQELPDTGLAADAYALLSPTAFLPITPENDDITAQLLLVSPEEEMTKAEEKHV